MSPLRSICGMTRYWATPALPHIGRKVRVLRPWALLRATDPLAAKVRRCGATTRRESGTNGGQKSPDETHWEVGHMGRIRVAMLAAAALMLVPAAGAQAKPKHHHHHGHGHDHGSAKLEKAVSVRNIVKHQQALQNIADMNGGTRHTETPGYTASVAYVKERMKRAGLERQGRAVQHPGLAGERAAGASSSSRRRRRRTRREPRRTTTARRSTTSRSGTRRRRPFRAPRWCRTNDIVDPEPGSGRQHARLRGGGLPRRRPAVRSR